MRSKISLLVFVIAVVAGGLAIGWLTGPADSAWYGQLGKPLLNPPSWVFGPVWTVLYILIGVTGWMVWRQARDNTLAVLWTAQLVLNFAWSPVFFIAHAIGPALLVIGLLLAVILAFVAIALMRKRTAEAAMFAVYAVWIVFATCLNAAIYMLNAA